MKAIVITGTGGPEVLKIREIPTPEPRGDQVRVRVRACGLNRADLLQARGMYPAPAGAPADIPGLEYAGEIDAIGPDVVGPLKPGDRVFGIVGGGGQAEFVLTHERMAVTIPLNLDFVQGAAIPEAFITAHDALLTQGRLAPGESVLIHAAASGVGTAAVQVAHAMGCQVLGTTRTASKLERLKALGLDVGIDTSRDSFAEIALSETQGRGVNVVIDLVGASVLAGNLAALVTRGRLILVGLLGGTDGPLDLSRMLHKRITIVGTTLRARPIE
jgi:NADPH:quinone reductase